MVDGLIPITRGTRPGWPRPVGRALKAASRSVRGGWRRCVCAAGLLLAVTAGARSSRAEEPESRRFDDQAFHDGLIQRGLLELLEVHLEVNPPRDQLARMLLERKVKLVIWADRSADAGLRRAAIAEANAILERLVREHSTDERAVDWQIELGRALIYDQAEPYYTAILLRGGGEADRSRLLGLMEQAVRVLENLKKNLETEYARIDELALAEYERLDQSGYVLKLEQAMPQADYMLRWARFYAAIAMEDSAPRRRELLTDVLRELTTESALLTTEHAVSHVQAQSLLLAGMSSRRLADNESANRYLRDAVDVVRNLPSPQERHDLQWIILLAGVERVRALRDAEKHQDALDVLGELHSRLASAGEVDFGRRLILAMLEASVRQAQAGAGRGADALRLPLTDAAIGPLAELAREQPAYRDEVYAMLYEQAGAKAAPEGLHPMQQCAIIAGLIGDATRLRHGAGAADAEASRRDEAAAMELLERAAALAAQLCARYPGGEDPYRCEALFNLGVAEHLRGQRVAAVQRFVEVSTTCRTFARALAAATYAVEISAELNEEPSLAQRGDVRELLLTSLRSLCDNYGDSDAARYWRFFYAQALEEAGERMAAAREYARVDHNHPHHDVARFRTGRCLADALMDYAAAHPDDDSELRSRGDQARSALEGFLDQSRSSSAQDDAGFLIAARAEAEVLAAEIDTLPDVGDPKRALARLADFEQRYPEQQNLIGRVLRTRIVAYEATGQLAEAEQAVPRYIASAPEQAGVTLQSLFDATWADVERSRARGANDQADAKARSALLFAEQLYRWAASANGTASPAQMYTLRVQLAEARLEAGQPAEALPLLIEAIAFDAQRYGDGMAHDPRLLLAQARTLYALRRFDEALPIYNRAFREAAVNAPHRFGALLGDLRCRTELGANPQEIIDVIRQHRFLSPELGGENVRKEFAELERQNEARRK